MSMTATVYARAAFDPRQHTTKTGQPMTTCRVAVDVTGRDESEAQTWWVDVLAFGRAAEDLAKLSKGDMLSAMGRCTRNIYTPQGGEPREAWTMLADSVITAKSGRPGGQRRASPARAA